MIHCKVLVLVAISVALTFIQAAPFDGMMGMTMDESGENKDENWPRDGEKENKDESVKLMELFLKCLKFLKEKHEEREKERKLHEFFKHIVKSMEELKDFHKMLGDRLGRQRGEGDMDKALLRFFDREDVDNNGNDDDDREEKMKKLFFIFMKFKSVLKEMKEKELEGKEEKHKKQFLVFIKFMKFAKESKAKLVMLGQLSKIIESKFKAKFMIFKKCLMEGHCGEADDESRYKDMEVDKGQGKDEDENIFGDHFEMFFHVMKHLREEQGGKYDGDMGMGVGGNDEGEQDDKKKIPVLELLMKIYKHVTERGKEFWGDRDLSPEEKMKKFVFFAYKCYKHIQELKAMKEKRTKIMELFYEFCKFLEQHENAARAEMEYYKFQKWQQDKINKAKVEEMRSFLKKVAIFKRMLADKKEQTDKEETMKKFFEEKMKEHVERERDDKMDIVKKIIDERMKEHMESEKNDKEELMRRFYEKMKEKNKEQDRDSKMKAMLQVLKHTDL